MSKRTQYYLSATLINKPKQNHTDEAADSGTYDSDRNYLAKRFYGLIFYVLKKERSFRSTNKKIYNF